MSQKKATKKGLENNLEKEMKYEKYRLYVYDQLEECARDKMCMHTG